MKSKEVLATKAMTELMRPELLKTGLRFKDVYQTSARAGFVYPNYMSFIWVFLKQYSEGPFMLFFFSLSNYHFSFEWVLLVSYARLR